MEAQLKVKILRDVKIPTYSFTDYFKGFEKIEAVRRIFDGKTDEVIRNLKVEFSSRRGYMGVSNIDGHITISVEYLKNGDIIDIYLDIIHELVHVKQFMEGKELFDNSYRYVDRPTELEAHRHAVEEARHIGLNDERICEYIRTEWMSDEDFRRLVKALKIKC